MKFIRITVFLILLTLNTKLVGQNISTIKYYDSSWIPTIRELSFFECQFKPYEDLYICTCFWSDTKSVKSISLKSDTTPLSRTFGLSLTYFKSKNIEDSNYYDQDGKLWKKYHFYENHQIADSIFYNTNSEIDSAFNYFMNGKVKAYYFKDEKTNKENFKIFDENGNELTRPIYFREAEFPKKDGGWLRFLQNNLQADIPTNNKAPNGEYQVIVRFTVQKDGSLKDIKAETNHGYGMEQEVIRILLKSPNWDPLILIGEPSDALRRQPVTFVVQEL